MNYFRDINNFLELNQTHSTNTLIFFIVIESFNRHNFTGCLLVTLRENKYVAFVMQIVNRILFLQEIQNLK